MNGLDMELPEGWEVKRLGEVCNLINGLWKGEKAAVH